MTEIPSMNIETMKGFADFLLNEKGLNENSVEAYLRHISYLYKEADADILKVCTKYADIAALIRKLKLSRKGKKQDTWKQNMAVKTAYMVSVFFNWAARERIIEFNPMQFSHEFKKEPSPPPRYFRNPDDLKKILSYSFPLSSPFESLRNRFVIKILHASGVRIKELCNLNMDDLDLEKRFIRVIEGKGGQHRMAYMDEDAVEIAREYLYEKNKLFNTEALIVKKNGERYKRDSLKKMVIGFGKKIGVEMSSHMFRHTLGRNLRRNKARLEDIADVLGHKSLSSTRIYTSLENDEVREIYDRFNVQTA